MNSSIRLSILTVFLGATITAAHASSGDDNIKTWSKEVAGLRKDDVSHLQAQANAGDERAAYVLYEVALRRPELGYTGKEIAGWMGTLASRGSPIGFRIVCYLQSSGTMGVKKDPEAGYRNCVTASEKGLASATLAVGFMLETGQGVGKDEKSALVWYRKTVEQGEGRGAQYLGNMYLNGRGVGQDDAQALGWYRKGAELGDPESVRMVGWMHEVGRAVAKDETVAAQWYRKAAEQKNGLGARSLANMYLNGRGVAKDDAQALAWYRKAAELNDPESNRTIAWMYENGRGVTKDEKAVLEWLRKGAELNDGPSAQSLGNKYLLGHGVAQDEAQALTWYRNGAALNDTGSIRAIGWMYLNGRGVIKDDAQALVWYQKGVELGDPESMVQIGWMHEFGRAVAKDETLAVQWYRKAAELRNGLGARSLGNMYLNGRGVAKDDAQALAWYRKAAELNDPESNRTIGWMHEVGRGVAKDEKVASEWYRKGAELNDGLSAQYLGNMYLNGRGLPKDDAQALAWYRKGAELGDVGSIGTIGWIFENSKAVTKDERAAAEWYRKAAELGHVDSMTRLGFLLRQDHSSAADRKSGCDWYQKAAETGSSLGTSNYGICLRDGDGRDKDERLAVSYFRKAADKGYIPGLEKLAAAYRRGIGGLDQDYKKALELFREGAAKGSPYSLEALGEMYWEGDGVQADYSEAVVWYHKAVEAGEAAGAANLCEIYRLGYKIPKDINRASEMCLRVLTMPASSATFLFGNESPTAKAKRMLDEMAASGEITDASVLSKMKSVTKPAPGVTWVNLPARSDAASVKLAVSVSDRGGGIGRLELWVDGRPSGELNKPGSVRNAGQLSVAGATSNVREIDLALTSGNYKIEIRAYGAENLVNFETLRAEIQSTYVAPRKPKLFALIVGVDLYKNKALELKFARSDARAMHQELRKQIDANGLYSGGELILLDTPEKTTKQSIVNAMRSLRDGGKLQWGDVFVLYVASHGLFDAQARRYWMLTSDVLSTSSERLMESAINNSELFELIAGVPTDKKLVLLDTCQSGGMLGEAGTKGLISTRSLSDQEIINTMKARSGATMLTASSEVQSAIEGYNGHGLFTWHVLNALRGSGVRKASGMLNTDDIKSYLEDEVPKASEKAFGKQQVPIGASHGGFPIAKLN